MGKILVIYGTSYGHTGRIAQRIADRLASLGFSITVRKGDDLKGHEPLDVYDGFVIGASVIAGKHQSYIDAFVRKNVARLNAVPAAFFSVSGSAGSTLPERRVEARALVEKFLEATRWTPARWATFGGMMAYSQYGFFLRWIMRMIARRNGEPTDTSRDHDYTDWAAVDRFAQDVAAVFKTRVGAAVS